MAGFTIKQDGTNFRSELFNQQTYQERKLYAEYIRLVNEVCNPANNLTPIEKIGKEQRIKEINRQLKMKMATKNIQAQSENYNTVVVTDIANLKKQND